MTQNKNELTNEELEKIFLEVRESIFKSVKKVLPEESMSISAYIDLLQTLNSVFFYVIASHCYLLAGLCNVPPEKIIIGVLDEAKEHILRNIPSDEVQKKVLKKLGFTTH